MESTLDLIYKVELLEELIDSQTRLLDTSTQIIESKSRMIDLCEEECKIYRRENAVLKLFLGASFVLIISLCGLLLYI
jgi:hypothetical protein